MDLIHFSNRPSTLVHFFKYWKNKRHFVLKFLNAHPSQFAHWFYNLLISELAVTTDVSQRTVNVIVKKLKKIQKQLSKTLKTIKNNEVKLLHKTISGIVNVLDKKTPLLFW